MTVLVWLVGIFVGCQSVPGVPLAQGGEPVLRSGSVVFAGVDGELYATAGADTIVQLTGRAGSRDSETVLSAYSWAGSSIVYATQEMDQTRGITGAIFSVVPGKSPRTLLRRNGFAPFFLYPSPDSSRIAYLGSEAGVAGLVMGSITAEGRDDLLHGRGQPFYAAWSPDSSTLLTHVGLPFGPSGSMMRLQSVMGMVSGEAPDSPLALSAAGFQAPAFSPDGERLAFVDGENTRTGGIVGKLWIANAADREMQLVSQRTTAFFWAPDSSRIVFLEPYLTGVGPRAALVYRVGVYRTFDGKSDYIAIMRPAEAFVQQVIPFFDQYLRAYTIWSPDSRLVVLNSTADDGTPVIHLVDTETLRSGEEFNVTYRIPAQSTAGTGLIAEDGINSRILGFGTVPFFSHADGLKPDGI